MRVGIKVFAPATVANVACGFDILGFALDKPGDEIIARFLINQVYALLLSKERKENGCLMS